MWRIYSPDNVLFLLHRITGIGLFAYLLAHIWVVSTALIAGPATFDRIMGALAAPGFLIVDLLLFGSVLFHTINGLRLLAHERGLWLEWGDVLARATLATWLALWVAAGAAAVAA